ncbi:hypothetical protein U0C82_08250 [Fulvimarina sp. 2208YS6-2-32]|uniref:Uncharacterized protein n=1 Tax=Fulvimarina uroteuthidis TaxID=3098149 RepID=A0ABU5I209_9HYPH|nr:hypothetical protein [Fulvimarina sp. 2208YS6-2-32]MDY8109135.1 hypothetical protein [Fulvimarina sp. 2208YS6-2-32]
MALAVLKFSYVFLFVPRCALFVIGSVLAAELFEGGQVIPALLLYIAVLVVSWVLYAIQDEIKMFRDAYADAK